MTAALKIAPLAVLLVGAVVLVWRGMRTKPDGTNNVESHGGADNV